MMLKGKVLCGSFFSLVSSEAAAGALKIGIAWPSAMDLQYQMSEDGIAATSAGTMLVRRGALPAAAIFGLCSVFVHSPATWVCFEIEEWQGRNPSNVEHPAAGPTMGRPPHSGAMEAARAPWVRLGRTRGRGQPGPGGGK